MATNGYTPEGLHPFSRGRVLPASSNIVVTRPLTEAEWREVGMLTTQVYSDTRKLLVSWRHLPDGRMLFGGRAGGLNTPAALRARRRRLEAAIADKWPVLQDVGSEYFDGRHADHCMNVARRGASDRPDAPGARRSGGGSTRARAMLERCAAPVEEIGGVLGPRLPERYASRSATAICVDGNARGTTMAGGASVSTDRYRHP